MNKDIFKLVNAAFDDFISVLIRNDCDRKCLLIAKTVNDLFFSVSGTKDHKNSCKKEYFDMLQDLKKKIDESYQAVYPNCKKNNDKFAIKYIPISDKVLFKRNKLDEGGEFFEFHSFESEKNGKYSLREYSCVERKTLAFFDNDLTSMDACNYIICRYLPCKMCYYAVRHLSNFYVFGEGFVYRIFIPENIHLPDHSLNSCQSLLYELSEERQNDNKDTYYLAPNYLFVKESVE